MDKRKRILGLVIFVVFGLVWTGFALCIMVGCAHAMFQQSELTKNGVEIQGVCDYSWTKEKVVDNEDGTSSVEYVYYADVSYEYNGTLYHKDNLIVKKDYDVGDNITLYISSADPEIVSAYLEDSMGYILTIMAIIPFAMAGIIVTVKEIRDNLIYRQRNEKAKIVDNLYIKDDYDIFNSANR